VKILGMCDSLKDQSQYYVSSISKNKILLNEKKKEIDKLQREYESILISSSSSSSSSHILSSTLLMILVELSFL
jgi:hypothetical protein